MNCYTDWTTHQITRLGLCQIKPPSTVVTTATASLFRSQAAVGLEMLVYREETVNSWRSVVSTCAFYRECPVFCLGLCRTGTIAAATATATAAAAAACDSQRRAVPRRYYDALKIEG